MSAPHFIPQITLTPFIFLLTLFTCLGCATTWQPDPENTLGKPQLLSPPFFPAKASDLLPLRPTKGLFKITQGDDEDQNVSFSLSPDGELWKLASMNGLQLTWFKLLPDQSLAIVREDDLDEEVSVYYQPHIIIIPPTLKKPNPNSPLTGQVTMTVLSTDDGSQRAAGTCQYQLRFLGKQKVKTPAGQFDAYIIQIDRQILLPIAHVNVRTLTAYVPGQGQIAEQVEQTTKALGFIQMDDIRETRLAR